MGRLRRLPDALPLRPGPVVVCGFGRVGQGILRLLDRLGIETVVVTSEVPPDAAREWSGTRFLGGDARSEELLEEAGIGTARALVAATDDDLANVSVALHAHRVRPGLPVVVRLFDQGLAEHLSGALGVRGAYSASALAAPAFVAAALGGSARQAFEAGGEAWVVEESGGSRHPPGTAGAAGAAGADDVHDTAGPGPDVVVSRAAAAAAYAPSRGTGAALLRGLRDSWRETPRGLQVAVYGLVALVLASVGVFHSALGLSFVDSLYFVITTVTTTGYGDINLQSASPSVKLFGTLVMLSGCALFAVLFSVLTDVLVGTRLGDLLARGATERKGHVVVAGLGHVGIRVLRELARHGEPAVAIERNESAPFVSAGRMLGPVVIGDAGAEETLRRAGVAGARTVLALTDRDLTNLSVALAARRANPSAHIVARIFDPTLAERLPRSLGIDAVLSLADEAAPTFVGAALFPGVVRGFVLGDRLCLLVRRRPGDGEAFGPGDRSERPLLVRPGREGPFAPVPPSGPGAGDEVIALRWIRLGPPV